MTTRSDAICTGAEYKNASFALTLVVSETGRKKTKFVSFCNPTQAERLREHFGQEGRLAGVKGIPVIYDSEWKIDWERVES